MLDGWPGQSPAGFVPRMLRIGRTLTLAEAVLGYRQNSGLRSGLPSEQVDVSNDFRRYLLKPLVLYRLRQCSSGIMIQVVRSSDLNSGRREAGHTLCGRAPSPWRARWMKSSGLIGAGSGHIPNDSTAADGLRRPSSIFAIATAGRVWSW